LSAPLEGVRVIELCDEKGAWAGRLFTSLGAEVIKVEPPGGDHTRTYAPFLDDQPGPERSLYFWYYNANKRSVTLDLESEDDRARFRGLVANADILLESQEPGEMARLGLDDSDLRPSNPGLIYVSVTPFGRGGPRANEVATDLTLAANGGFAWMNGYDDHALPCVRGGGNQAYHTGCHFAVMSAMVALLHRDVTGEGQFIDVNTNAAVNVTTEAGSYTWLVNKGTVQRQTGRHAGIAPSMPTQVLCADGRYVNTGVPPRKPKDFHQMLEWLKELNLYDDFHSSPLLELGMARERIDLSKIAEDVELQAIFGAGREAYEFIASRIDAYTFFSGGQRRGFQVGIIYPPEDVFTDPHFVARGWPVPVELPEFGRTVTFPGVPIAFGGSPMAPPRPAPHLGEGNATFLT
jgi:crotonobetainyl-CoA:carnitine CoA-transferase CaiB-like acyl-CoA transferase